MGVLSSETFRTGALQICPEPRKFTMLWSHKLQISRELGGILRRWRPAGRGRNRKSEKQLFNSTDLMLTAVAHIFFEGHPRSRS